MTGSISRSDGWAIEVEGLGKAYRMYKRPLDRFVEWGSAGRLQRHGQFWSLRDVNFKLRPGSSMGLCGANGAGKSTLLKVLSGITAPTEGRLKMRGRVASLLELGAGFHLDFTGRANIFMNGVMMGFSRREMAAKVDEIIEFAELGNYIDEPVRTYSSGMGLRLGFSIAVAVDPDILIIDEVFAVGDMYFQKKCIDKIYSFKQRNKTILFCSHSLYDVRQLCDEALWMRDGRAAAQGDSVYVTNEYTAFQRDHIGEQKEVLGDEIPNASDHLGASVKLPRIRDARVYRLGTEEETYEITSGDSVEIRVWWENPDPAATPIHLGVGFLRQDMTTCGGMGTHLDGLELEGTSGCTVLEMPNVKLLAGQFLVPILLLDEGGVHKYQEFLLPENLVVRSVTRDVGLFRLDHAWRLNDDRPVPAPVEREAEEAR
ncbi:polysaccharide ABC transporter ATP-binding protein [Engelhardtia mirabilis]|uniref:Teichoic acids export ATP-binding protein TagH n=1 Tax=Engelhardtia mirabilis TaxID=2528011 RepID=A0A518BI85_9BACT|nr:Teichoic acids export ATP-binding protein TagH [Planctomycetes bacterium Pla133]QDV01016.1 Teichoic acids export ATP-binding protein TagH [Planctomycetes bacterium Pla86]